MLYLPFCYIKPSVSYITFLCYHWWYIVHIVTPLAQALPKTIMIISPPSTTPPTTNTTMSHIPDKRKPSSSIPGDTPYKRSRVSYADDDNEEYASQSPAAMTHERPRNNPLYGQKSAFPGLDVDAEGELFYGPAEDGLEYLRMVR